MNWKHVIALFLLLWIASAGAWGAEKPRAALVIGNERYETQVGALRNSGNDAKAIARLLRSLGFAVTEKHDLKRDALLRAMEDFRQSLAGKEVALFYYAGHGVSINGSNYLIPLKSGFDPAGADSVALHLRAETRLYNAEQAVADMTTGGAKCNLVILDACRTTRLAASQTRGTGDGSLTEMTPPAGSLIAFATDSGHTALDGDGKNGLYTEELLKNLSTPGITIEQVFKRTRSGVIRRSEGAQVPAEYSRLLGEDIFLAGSLAAPAVPAPKASPVPAAPEQTREETLAAICKLASAGTANAAECIQALTAFAQREGAGEYAAAPIDTLLEAVKNDLKTTQGPSTKAITAAATCDRVLRALPDFIPPQSPRFADLAAKANSRRGDALLLLGRAEEALAAFNAALNLRPADPYVLFNRGTAQLALGNTAAARADFQAAENNTSGKAGARKLAREALARMK